MNEPCKHDIIELEHWYVHSRLSKILTWNSREHSKVFVWTRIKNIAHLAVIASYASYKYDEYANRCKSECVLKKACFEINILRHRSHQWSTRPSHGLELDGSEDLFCFAWFWTMGVYGRTDTMCENSDHYRPGLWSASWINFRSLEVYVSPIFLSEFLKMQIEINLPKNILMQTKTSKIKKHFFSIPLILSKSYKR